MIVCRGVGAHFKFGGGGKGGCRFSVIKGVKKLIWGSNLNTKFKGRVFQNLISFGCIRTLCSS